MQQINLLNPALIKKTELLNPNNIALLLGVMLLALLGYAWMENQALSKLQQTREQVAKQLASTEMQMTEMREIQAKKNDVAAQLKQIEALEQKITMQNEMIKAIGLNNTAQSQSYAEILKAFSRQSIDGLWITGLSIDQNTEVLSIQGRTQDANLLPTFIANLRREAALKGKTFTDLTMESNEKKLPRKNEGVAQASALSNAKPENDATQVAARQIPPYVEFVLHSVIDKNALPTTQEKLGAVEGVLH